MEQAQRCEMLVFYPSTLRTLRDKDFVRIAHVGMKYLCDHKGSKSR